MIKCPLLTEECLKKDGTTENRFKECIRNQCAAYHTYIDDNKHRNAIVKCEHFNQVFSSVPVTDIVINNLTQ